MMERSAKCGTEGAPGKPGETCPFPEYPRPQMVRPKWTCLNGLWNCTFSDSPNFPPEIKTPILVPFSPESLLSRVQRQLRPGEYLWYERVLELEEKPKAQRCLLHFGAVDRHAVLYINGREAGRHSGGYLSFTFDITEALVPGQNRLVLRVQDETDLADGSRGKQKLNCGGIFYTAQSGIWQTVWLEWVPSLFICLLRVQPEPDRETVSFGVELSRPAKIKFAVRIFSGKKEIASGRQSSEQRLVLSVRQPHLWSPEDPFLYTAEVVLEPDTAEPADRIETYFAMRTVSVEKTDGIARFCLNHKACYLNGVLDQGYWSDGLYTAPDDRSLADDILAMKRHGFNMLRKHCKIESERWYYHCDRLGMLVWQDMVCGGGKYRAGLVTVLPTLFPNFSLRDDRAYGILGRENAGQRAAWEQECLDTIGQLGQHPCISTWVLFNEGWGQFDSVRLSALLKKTDPFRTVDAASGWFDRGAGDFRSLHIYFRRLRFPKSRSGDERACVLSEYGGYAFAVPGHTGCRHRFGYRLFQSRPQLNSGCRKLIGAQLKPMIKKGLSGSVYTQLSDVEGEINGILTYDRAADKFDDDVFCLR